MATWGQDRRLDRRRVHAQSMLAYRAERAGSHAYLWTCTVPRNPVLDTASRGPKALRPLAFLYPLWSGAGQGLQAAWNIRYRGARYRGRCCTARSGNDCLWCRIVYTRLLRQTAYIIPTSWYADNAKLRNWVTPTAGFGFMCLLTSLRSRAANPGRHRHTAPAFDRAGLLP